MSLNEEIEKLKSLSEDPKHLQHLKPVDVFFEIIEHDQATNDIHMNSEQSAQGGKLRVFYCYSHEDSELRKQLSKHLSSLRHQGLTEEWHDREIYPGDNWRQQIDSNLTGAHIVLLLVSSSFIHSEFCFNVELKKAMERQKAKECIVIPVIFRACDWQHTPLESLQALPEDGKAVTSWNNIDEAFANVALGIRKAISGFIPK